MMADSTSRDDFIEWLENRSPSARIHLIPHRTDAPFDVTAGELLQMIQHAPAVPVEQSTEPHGFTVDDQPCLEQPLMFALRLNGHPVSWHYQNHADALRAALATPPPAVVETPPGLTGPSAEGTWYGPLGKVPSDGCWQVRKHAPSPTYTHAESYWKSKAASDVRREWAVGTVVVNDLVPLPVTEEVPLHELIGRKLPGETWLIAEFRVRHNGVGTAIDFYAATDSHARYTSGESSPGMVTVQREGDEK